MYSATVSAINHPDVFNPYIGLFNHRSIRSLDDAGVELNVVSPRPFAPPVGPYSEHALLPDTERWGGITVHHPRFLYLLPKRVLYRLAGRSLARRLPAYLDDHFEAPDVAHGCHIYPDGYGLRPYCDRHGLPLFVVAHGAFLNDLDGLAWGVRAKVLETLRTAEGVLCVSEALAETAREHVRPGKVQVVPIGADPEQFPVARRDALREEVGISTDATVVLFVGAFTERKGLREIIDVLPTLDEPNLEFVFVGSTGGFRGELIRSILASRYSSEHLYWALSTLALRRWFAIADVLMLPSHAEGRPTVIYEAMASETAVVSTTVGGIPEQVVDGETGVLIPPEEARALQTALESVAADREWVRTMGKNGLARLRERGWTWTDHAQRVCEVHEEAIE